MQDQTDCNELEAFSLDLLKGTGVEDNTPQLGHGTSTSSQLAPALSGPFPWDGLDAELDCASTPLDFLAAQQVTPSPPFTQA